MWGSSRFASRSNPVVHPHIGPPRIGCQISGNILRPEVGHRQNDPTSPAAAATGHQADHRAAGCRHSFICPTNHALQDRDWAIIPRVVGLPSGTKIGQYEIQSLLGAGGMGEVYRALDPRLKRSVAVKVLAAEVSGEAERLGRFKREAQILASLNHSNIAVIHGMEQSDGIEAIVMELVEGKDLSQLLASGQIALPDAISLAKQMVDALEAAHQKGIIHRDLKPGNIRISTDGRQSFAGACRSRGRARWAPHRRGGDGGPGSRGVDFQPRDRRHQSTITAGFRGGRGASMVPAGRPVGGHRNQ